MGRFDETLIDFTCPGCGQQIRESIGRLKQNPYRCPGCGGVFDTEQVGRAMQEAEGAVDELVRKLHGGEFLKGGNEG